MSPTAIYVSTLERSPTCTSINSASVEDSHFYYNVVLDPTDGDLEQELETARYEIAKHEYIILGRPREAF